MAPSNTQKHARAPVAITRSAANDIAAVLIKHNPAAPKTEIETTVRAVVATLKIAVKHSHLQRSRIVLPAEEVAQAFVDPASRQASGRTANKRLIDVAAEAPVEESQGEGFGELLPAEEGRKRVAAYATPVRLEDWAGSVAGPGKIERDFGTRRSTLHDWQKRGAVIGLLKGERKHVYPLAQFIDGRPIEGMARITKIIANPRAAWLWLTRPHPTGDKTPPLERLKQGRIAEVAAAAERDFG
jgi:hypothetical protein